jgi:hypothetical protein
MSRLLVPIVAANAVGAIWGETAGVRILKNATKVRGVKIVGCAEADDIPRGTLDRKIWRTIHRPHHVEKDGCLLALRRDSVKVIGRPKWIKLCDGVRPSRGDKGMNARWMLLVRVRYVGTGVTEVLAVVHFAPDRYMDRQEDCVRRTRQVAPDLFLGDTNMGASEMRRAFPEYSVRTVEVMNVASRRVSARGSGAVLLPARSVRIGSDHPGNRTTRRFDL